eukprot:IDg1648t1
MLIRLGCFSERNCVGWQICCQLAFHCEKVMVFFFPFKNVYFTISFILHDGETVAQHTAATRVLFLGLSLLSNDSPLFAAFRHSSKRVIRFPPSLASLNISMGSSSVNLIQCDIGGALCPSLLEFEHGRFVVRRFQSLLSELELEGNKSLPESLSLGSNDDESSLGSSGFLLVLVE